MSLPITDDASLQAILHELKQRVPAYVHYLDGYLFATGLTKPVTVSVPINSDGPDGPIPSAVDYLPWLAGDCNLKVNHTYVEMDITDVVANDRQAFTIFHIDQENPLGNAGNTVPTNVCVRAMTGGDVEHWKGNILVLGRGLGTNALCSLTSEHLRKAADSVMCIIRT